MLAKVLSHELRSKSLTALEPVIGGGPYAIVDFPDYANVGDSAIWLGQMKMLKILHGRGPAYVASQHSLDMEKLRTIPGTIYISGGGNFGDIYRNHQDYRERLLKELPEHHIVQLPQSIHYNEEAALRQTRKLIDAHRNFTLCVRDQPSLRVARSFECRTVLMPDSAFFLDLERTGHPKHEVFYLHRCDDEAVGHKEHLPDEWCEDDWWTEPSSLRKFGKLEGLAKAVLTGALTHDAARVVAYECLAQRRLQRGVQMLSTGYTVVTDRLHAHILCTLLGISHFALDNNYGKIHNCMDAWGTDRVSATVVGSLSEVISRFNRRHDFADNVADYKETWGSAS